MDQVMLESGNANVNVTPFPALGSIPKSTSRLLAISPGPSQVNPFPRAPQPNFAHFDPWRSVGSPMLSFLLLYHPVSPMRPLQADTAQIHAQLQASNPEKISQPYECYFLSKHQYKITFNNKKKKTRESETLEYTTTAINESTSEQMNKDGISFLFCQETGSLLDWWYSKSSGVQASLLPVSLLWPHLSGTGFLSRCRS